MSTNQQDYQTSEAGSRLARYHNAFDHFGWNGYNKDMDAELINNLTTKHNASKQFIDSYISELHGLINLKFSLNN